MYSVKIIDTPSLLLESLIEDTYNDKIKWEISEMEDLGIKSTTTISIPNTKKFLIFEFYDLGSASFMKTTFNKGFFSSDIIDFESINVLKEKERLIRLSQAIYNKKK